MSLFPIITLMSWIPRTIFRYNYTHFTEANTQKYDDGAKLAVYITGILYAVLFFLQKDRLVDYEKMIMLQTSAWRSSSGDNSPCSTLTHTPTSTDHDEIYVCCDETNCDNDSNNNSDVINTTAEETNCDNDNNNVIIINSAVEETNCDNDNNNIKTEAVNDFDNR